MSWDAAVLVQGLVGLPKRLIRSQAFLSPNNVHDRHDRHEFQEALEVFGVGGEQFSAMSG